MSPLLLRPQGMKSEDSARTSWVWHQTGTHVFLAGVAPGPLAVFNKPMTKNQPDITKLPKWAQEHITDLQRQRDNAVDSLNKWCDSQTPSNVTISERVWTGEQQGSSFKCRYVQTDQLKISHAGIDLDIHIHEQGSIFLSWYAGKTKGEVALIPTGHQQARLVSQPNMRT